GVRNNNANFSRIPACRLEEPVIACDQPVATSRLGAGKMIAVKRAKSQRPKLDDSLIQGRAMSNPETCLLQEHLDVAATIHLRITAILGSQSCGTTKLVSANLEAFEDQGRCLGFLADTGLCLIVKRAIQTT